MEVDLDDMQVLNEVRYEISRLSKESRYEFESVVRGQLGNSEIWDEDYLIYCRGVLGEPVMESEDDGGLHYSEEFRDGDLDDDGHVQNLVAKSEHEDLDHDVHVENSVEKTEHEDLDHDVHVEILDAKPEHEDLDDDVHVEISDAKPEQEDLDDDVRVENSVAKSENEDSDDDDHFVNSVGESENEASDDDDPQYKIFLSHLKGNGKSFTFEIKDENGLSKIFEYQKEQPIDGWPSQKIDRNVNNVVEKKRLKKRGRSRSEPKISKNVKRSCLKSVSLGKSYISSHKHTLRNQRVSRSKPKSKEEGLGKMGEKQHEKPLNVRRHDIKKEQESLVEEDYKRFLSSAQIVAGSIELPHRSDKIIVYDREVDLCHKVTSLGPSSSCKNNVEDEDGCQILDGCFESDQLKEKVMAILRKPFDGQEYKTLWHAITQKKYKLRHRELKDNRELSVPTEIKAKSYLEQHAGLRRQIEAVPDNKYRRLNILRGFFFWLQHAAWGVSFKPWEDASCLAVMPRSHVEFF